MPKRSLRVLFFAALTVAVYSVLFYAGASTAPGQAKDLAPTVIQLQPVLTGLGGPILLTNAKDGTNRLFVAEQPGVIRVAQPGAGTATVFLDIQARVLDGGERGLLGLAFHPQYSTNGRFFVYYTRDSAIAADDGDIVISEFRVSAGNMNVADPNSEIIILTIEHTQFGNHNGGMLEFGPDGFLYAGTGDGGSGFDPNNNGQNINSLLGKMLRIDINTPNPPFNYSSPPTNPFVGVAGADEIFALGLRNPWRWSFDRGGSNQLYLADVGQGSWEEIDIITLGGNYGWRVFEGAHCSGNDPGLCTAASPCNINGYTCPIAEYSSASPSTRCSITGGYIYRGARNAVPVGAYIYGDFCTGEILQLFPATAAGTQTLLLDTSNNNLSSFGEDEAGEIYVAKFDNTITRIANTPAPPACTLTISNTSQLFPNTGGLGSFTMSTASDCNWLAVSHATWIEVTSAKSNTGTGTVNFNVKPNDTGMPRTGRIFAGGRAFTVTQEGLPGGECTFVISPTQRSHSAGGGSGNITVTTDVRCAWEAVASDSWITITSGQTGSGNGTVSYTVAPNTTGAMRKGTITIGGRVFSVKQKRG
ncbi:MAG TPA: PQQ-dependent sugar dehydrogenase [Blastocatellia bacterium]|nr:PQQ-dependent sugar dehydrogenase [Blastocatellia bacterium]